MEQISSQPPFGSTTQRHPKDPCGTVSTQGVETLSTGVGGRPFRTLSSNCLGSQLKRHNRFHPQEGSISTKSINSPTPHKFQKVLKIDKSQQFTQNNISTPPHNTSNNNPSRTHQLLGQQSLFSLIRALMVQRSEPPNRS
jgi:hypothetical protein